MKRIGIMGGTFNPIHSVHLIMAEVAYHQFHLDKILFMPSKNPPHKCQSEIVSDEHRTRMIQLAIEGNNHFEFSDMELKREGITYTSDTLKQLVKEHKEFSYYFIIGGDSLWQLEDWYMPNVIFKHCHILAARRGQSSRKEFHEKILYYENKYNAKISHIEMENIHISSERIRNHIKNKEPYFYYCPDNVSQYIAYHGLYGYENQDSKKLKKSELTMTKMHSMLKCTCKPKHFTHMLGVQYTSTSLAMIHDCDLKKAELAGALHDCAKHLTFEEQLKICNKHNLSLTKIEKNNPQLIHAKLGVYIASKKYNVHDEEVLDAIRYHTTGRVNMTLLEKIVYIADYIEPNRKMKCCPYRLHEVRKMAYENIDETLCMILENSIYYLESTNSIIDPLTMESYEYYKNKIG